MAATTNPPAPQAPQSATQKPASSGLASKLQALLASGGTTALISWAAGEAARTGWGKSLPFLPTWMVVALAALVFIAAVTFAFRSWHSIKLDYAARAASIEKATEVYFSHVVIPQLEKEIETKGLDAALKGLKF